MKGTYGLIVLAFACWFGLFSPWTKDWVPFWPGLAAAVIVLNSLGWILAKEKIKLLLPVKPKLIFWGFGLTLLLYMAFWVGQKGLYLLWSSGHTEVANIYALKTQASPWLIGILLIFVIGPGEELFWRGFVQTQLVEKWGTVAGFMATVFCYSAIHVFAFNLTIVLAALVVGVFWGICRVWFKSIIPGLISHALWDLIVFVILPLNQ